MSGPRRAVEQTRRPRSLWRPVLALAAAVVLGVGGASSYAYWQDTAQVTTGQITAGTLDLQLDSGGAVGTGTAYTKTSIAASNLYPGERLAFPLTVRNVGGVPVRYSATVTRAASQPWTYDATAITLQVYAGPTTAAGTSYPRTGSCGGTALHSSAVAVAPSGGPQALFSARGPLGGGAEEPLCLLVAMPSTAANANQGKTGTLQLDLTAEQVVP
ncbi:hypothetical protein GC722_01525 [Auraticoccus sp. F435]|uniref:Ribosomally synthesized peptide with SipW-like signal peptide n=1 Tax=Auraticoccus cholistanensis TaxID=2656650 RepID=A0A6A9V033_9ACTN|nr:SipW-dependent-type signal peptide-containing protein [Auraticoccus cholistanensis]MVA74720.1 hypothetical protein [Auraticoccus cholistanensis]